MPMYEYNLKTVREIIESIGQAKKKYNEKNHVLELHIKIFVEEFIKYYFENSFKNVPFFEKDKDIIERITKLSIVINYLIIISNKSFPVNMLNSYIDKIISGDVSFKEQNGEVEEED